MKPGQNAMPANEFIDSVRQALSHLYDFSYLQEHPLVRRDSRGAQRAELAGAGLRQAIIAAIEALDPGEGVPFSSPPARLHNILQIHYIEALTVQECAQELEVSIRQAYRDLRQAEENVAAILWDQLLPSANDVRASDLSALETEAERLELHPVSLDLLALLGEAQSSTQPLAQAQGVSLHMPSHAAPVIVSADAVVAQQVLTSLLSSVIQQAQDGAVSVDLSEPDGMPITLRLRSRSLAQSQAPAAVAPFTLSLAERLGWSINETIQDGVHHITVTTCEQEPVILVIDDNEGLVELLKRYLTDRMCRVVAASNGREGLQLAQDIKPTAVVLDVMMPGIDGWKVLQTLRNRAETAAIPVLICSVFNDPNLARSLGASGFLAKPVSRASILEALAQLGVV